MIFNNDAEKAVLASIIIDKNKINTVLKLLTPDDFYNEVHKNIYKAILDLYNDNTPVDIITLSNKGFEITFIASLIDNLTTSEGVTHYAQIVKGKSIRRRYHDVGQDIQQMALNGEYENITDFKNDIMQKVDIEIIDKKSRNNITNIVCDAVMTIERRAEGIEDNGLKYGLKWLDNWTGGAKSNELTILAARPSVGKTSLALQIAINIATRNKYVAVFSLEMGEEQLIERMICNISGVSLTKIRSGIGLTKDDWDKINQASGVISAIHINIIDDVFKSEEIRAECRSLRNKKELDFVVIDYLQLCESMKKTGNETERLSSLSRQFKLLNKELKVPILLLSQLNRDNEKDNRKPLLKDLRGSGSIEQDADNVLFLHDPNTGDYEENEKRVDELMLIIAKQRSGERDKCTSKEVKFIKTTQRWVNN
jgi:replicative DNA helicase